MLFFVQQESGKRDSDPRPQPWQGCALPTELFPHFNLHLGGISLNASAKVMLFSELANFFHIFFQKKCHFIEKQPIQRVNPYDSDNLRSQIDEVFPIYHLHVTFQLMGEKYH